MSRIIFPYTISYESLLMNDVYKCPQKEMLDTNLVLTFKDQKDSSQTRRITRKLLVKKINFILFIRNHIHFIFYIA